MNRIKGPGGKQNRKQTSLSLPSRGQHGHCCVSQFSLVMWLLPSSFDGLVKCLVSKNSFGAVLLQPGSFPHTSDQFEMILWLLSVWFVCHIAWKLQYTVHTDAMRLKCTRCNVLQKLHIFDLALSCLFFHLFAMHEYIDIFIPGRYLKEECASLKANPMCYLLCKHDSNTGISARKRCTKLAKDHFAFSGPWSVLSACRSGCD